ncbi:hypothetical protein ACIBKY_51185 [Nonomuraea sp. NPDC050394]|uniref:hypothetical protein n=1 Tax=Nonomuraea sp. NPDC050394 TaxID=3364363 RepID=UPI0037A81928
MTWIFAIVVGYLAFVGALVHAAAVIGAVYIVRGRPRSSAAVVPGTDRRLRSVQSWR